MIRAIISNGKRWLAGEVRKFAAASSSRLFADWILACQSPKDDIRSGLATLRSRARDLEQNNAYAKRYLCILETEVVGAEGFQLQNQATRYAETPSGEALETVLTAANNRIEKEFAKWGRKGNCTVCGKFSWPEVQRKVLRWTARDGDMAVVIRRGSRYGKWGMQLQLLRGDYIDHDYTMPYRDGSRIDMGIEFNTDGRAIAYHVFSSDPADSYGTGYQRVRIPAADVLYMADPQNPDEPRSPSWLHAIMPTLKILDGGTEAELVAMRAQACKVFSWEDIGGVNNGGDERKLTNTDITTEKLSPGQSVYRPGKKMTAVNPTHPNGNFPNFYNCILHQVAAGLMISHATLAGNLEKVNMSSIRAGLLLELAYYMILQNWLRDTLCTPVFSIWLEQAILAGRLPYSHADLEMYDAPTWQAKRWPWIDPLKDITAFIMLRRARWMSDSQIIAAQGGNFETVRTAIKRDAEYDEANGTTPPDDAFRAALESLDETQLIRLATSLQQSEEPAA